MDLLNHTFFELYQSVTHKRDFFTMMLLKKDHLWKRKESVITAALFLSESIKEKQSLKNIFALKRLFQME